MRIKLTNLRKFESITTGTLIRRLNTFIILYKPTLIEIEPHFRHPENLLAAEMGRIGRIEVQKQKTFF